MSNSPISPNNSQFWLAATIVILLTAGLSASAWPAVHVYSTRQAAILATQSAQQSRGNELNFRIINLLDPANPIAANALASQALATRDWKKAARILQHEASTSTLPYCSLVFKTTLEGGDMAIASRDADQLIRLSNVSEDDLLLVAAARGTEQISGGADDLASRLNSLEARQRLQALQSDKLAAAIELSRQGLLNASQRALLQIGESVPRNLQLARLTLLLSVQQGTMKKQQAHALAITLYKRALQLDPANQEIRRALIQALQDNGDASSAAQEQQRLDQLISGKP